MRSRVEARAPLEQGAHDRGGEVVRAHARERAAVAPVMVRTASTTKVSLAIRLGAPCRPSRTMTTH